MIRVIQGDTGRYGGGGVMGAETDTPEQNTSNGTYMHGRLTTNKARDRLTGHSGPPTLLTRPWHQQSVRTYETHPNKDQRRAEPEELGAGDLCSWGHWNHRIKTASATTTCRIRVTHFRTPTQSPSARLTHNTLTPPDRGAPSARSPRVTVAVTELRHVTSRSTEAASHAGLLLVGPAAALKVESIPGTMSQDQPPQPPAVRR